MIKKIKSIKDGNSLDVLNLKLKRVFLKNKFNINKRKKTEIPIIINNRNRLYFLKKLLNYLECKKYSNIIIIDNQSTYIPLIEFYNKCKYKIIRLQKNLGYLALWKIDFFNKIKDNFYVYTDPDILPTEDCPHDFIEYFLDFMNKKTDLEKVGFSLKIDDLPINDNYNNIIKNEKKFWRTKIPGTNFFDAPIDTTFALYRPHTYGGYWLNCARSDSPYLARHLSWYDDKDKQEELFYYSNIKKNSSFYTSNRFINY
jgi:hypothetical protein